MDIRLDAYWEGYESHDQVHEERAGSQKVRGFDGVLGLFSCTHSSMMCLVQMEDLVEVAYRLGSPQPGPPSCARDWQGWSAGRGLWGAEDGGCPGLKVSHLPRANRVSVRMLFPSPDTSTLMDSSC